jgi:hypothetical protein
VNFDPIIFGEVCLWVLPVVLFLTMVVRAVLTGVGQRFKEGGTIIIIFSYIFCVGVIVHEAAHRLMCALFNVQVEETVFFYVERTKTEDVEKTKVGGHVVFTEVDSFIAGAGIAIAPLVVNGLLVALIFYYWPLLGGTEFYGAFAYLGAALAIGANPSKQDLTVMGQTFAGHTGRALLELFALIGLCTLSYALLVVWQVELWVTLTVLISYLAVLVYQGRARGAKSPARSLPRI